MTGVPKLVRMFDDRVTKQIRTLASDRFVRLYENTIGSSSYQMLVANWHTQSIRCKICFDVYFEKSVMKSISKLKIFWKTMRIYEGMKYVCYVSNMGARRTDKINRMINNRINFISFHESKKPYIAIMILVTTLSDVDDSVCAGI